MTLSPGQVSQGRRSFLKALLCGLALPGLWLARGVQKRAESLPELSRSTLLVPWVPGPGIRFHDRVIIVTTAAGVSVFSSACPHLGCRIDRTEGGEIVCPCHGSRFNDRGELAGGPAPRGLRPLKFTHDREAGVLRIHLESA